MMKILFIGKKDDARCEQAFKSLDQKGVQLDVVLGRRGEEFPERLGAWQGDYIISYLSPWIVPEALLEKAGKAAINFHPGPPEYPGIGCTNFAIYDGATTYGITCHHMAPRVDTGAIIAVRRFAVVPSDTVDTLTQQSYDHLLACFYDVTKEILHGRSLPQTSEHWTRVPYTRRELNELCRITLNMSEEEIKRRVKSVTYPGMPGAYIELAGEKFIWIGQTPEQGKAR